MLKAISEFDSSAVTESQHHPNAQNKQSDKLYFEKIINHMLGCICLMDQNGRLIYVSPSVTNLLGYSEQSIFAATSQLIHPADRDKIKTMIKTLLEADCYEQCECRVRHQENHYVWFKIVGNSLTKPIDGTREIILASCDITELKLAEQEIEERANYLNTLIDTMSELLFTYDRNLRITLMNKRCCQYLGYEPFEAIGKNLLDIFPEENKLEIINNAVRCLLEGRTGDYEINIKRKDGTLLPVRVRSSPITENKYVIGGLVLCEDITEHVRIKQEMARLAQLHMVGEIAAGIGHEIRNPMTTVQGFLQLLSHNEELAKFSSYFDLMLEELERANGIISEFLSLAGNKMANFQRININHIVNSIYPLLQADATVDDKEIRFIPGTINEILLDEKEIRQLILNLVRNGLEAMSAGGRVTISTEQMYDKVRLSVRDEGPGIDPAVMEKMGTPFFTTKDNGTGLGLAVCYGIIARHQATLDVQTGPRGTTFNIDFKLNMDMDA